MVEAITFDLDGVYFPDGKAQFMSALGGLGVSADMAKWVFSTSDEMSNQYKTGKMSDEQYWSWAMQQCDLAMTPNQAVELLISGYEVDERVADVVRQVRSNGYKTLICSNNFPARINGLQERFGFLDDFDETVFSYEVGATKPSTTIFNELIRRAGVEPPAIVFADDAPENITGAQAVGITTFVYESFNQFTDQLRILGVRL